MKIAMLLNKSNQKKHSTKKQSGCFGRRRSLSGMKPTAMTKRNLSV